MDTTGGDPLYRIHEAATAGQAVELHYTPTTADMAEALRARNRTPAGRRQRRPYVLLSLLGPVLATVLIVRDGGTTPVTTGLLAGVVFGWAYLLFGHRMMARAFRGVLETAGDCTAVVDEHGVAVTGSRSSTHHAWTALAHYAQTPAHFALFSGDRQAATVTVLPVRGLADPADADRLRAILDRNLTRV
ncbi:YcxB family protein [Streptomyces sp. NPDC058525]|uniref:YcxB family protein n=1 Tax=unclassified Streptomyces TaxID=2593676 RepID=UPI00364C2A45